MSTWNPDDKHDGREFLKRETALDFLLLESGGKIILTTLNWLFGTKNTASWSASGKNTATWSGSTKNAATWTPSTKNSAVWTSPTTH